MVKSNIVALVCCLLFYSYIPFKSYIYDHVSSSSSYSDFYDEMASKASLTEDEMQEWRVREKEYVEHEMSDIELDILKYQNLLFILYASFAFFSLKFIYKKTSRGIVFLTGFYYAFVLFIF